jgi:hypothetical protein
VPGTASAVLVLIKSVGPRWRVEKTPLARFLLDGRGASVKYTDTDGRLFYTPGDRV